MINIFDIFDIRDIAIKYNRGSLCGVYNGNKYSIKQYISDGVNHEWITEAYYFKYLSKINTIYPNIPTFIGIYHNNTWIINPHIHNNELKKIFIDYDCNYLTSCIYTDKVNDNIEIFSKLFKNLEVFKDYTYILMYNYGDSLLKYVYTTALEIYSIHFICNNDLSHQTIIADGEVESYNSSTNMKISNILLLLYQISESLTYLHHNGIYHKDIKPSNICYNNKQKRYTLIDYSHSHIATNQDTFLLSYIDYLQSQRYITPDPYRRPPEQYGLRSKFRSNNKTLIFIDMAAADIWSLAISIIELLAGTGVVAIDEMFTAFRDKENYILKSTTTTDCCTRSTTEIPYDYYSEEIQHKIESFYITTKSMNNPLIELLDLIIDRKKYTYDENTILLVNVLRQMLDYNPETRITSKEIYDILCNHYNDKQNTKQLIKVKVPDILNDINIYSGELYNRIKLIKHNISIGFLHDLSFISDLPKKDQENIYHHIYKYIKL